MPEALQQPGRTVWKKSAAELRRVRSLTGGGLLAAAGAVLELAVIPINQLLQVGFSFLATALSGYLYGPLVAGCAGVVVDLLGFILRPTGAFFLGFTLNEFVVGVVYGLWLYNRPIKLWRVFCAVLTAMALVSFVLNPLWLHIMYGEAFWALVWMRVPKNAVMLPVNTALLYALLRGVAQYKKTRA